jgi:hypothetical protein
MSVDVERRYEKLLASYRKHVENVTKGNASSLAPTHRQIPRGAGKASDEIRKALFLYAASRFADEPTTAGDFVLMLLTDAMMTAKKDRILEGTL